MPDRTNLSPEQITIKNSQRRDVSMNLPRVDDGNVHQAVGMRSNASAAHYADAMGRVFAGPAGKPWKQATGR